MPFCTAPMRTHISRRRCHSARRGESLTMVPSRVRWDLPSCPSFASPTASLRLVSGRRSVDYSPTTLRSFADGKSSSNRRLIADNSSTTRRILVDESPATRRLLVDYTSAKGRLMSPAERRQHIDECQHMPTNLRVPAISADSDCCVMAPRT